MIQTQSGVHQIRGGKGRVDTDPVRGSPDQGREGPGSYRPSQGFTRSGERRAGFIQTQSGVHQIRGEKDRVDTDPVRGSPDQGREGPG